MQIPIFVGYYNQNEENNASIRVVQILSGMRVRPV